MRTITGRYRIKHHDHVATCPYCKKLNILSDEVDSCDHLYECYADGHTLPIFYFAKNIMPMRIGY